MPDETAPPPAPKKPKVAKYDDDLWFALFVSLGPGRTANGVITLAESLGMRAPSVKSVQRWSSEKDWVDRARAFDDNVAAQREGLLSDAIIDMNARQAEAGRMLSKAAVDALERTKSGIDVSDVPRFLEAGTKVERLAMGAATERSEIAVGFVNTMIPEIVQLFISINMVGDPGDRLDQLTAGLNEIARRFIIAG